MTPTSDYRLPTSEFHPNGMATAIGSMPHASAEEAVKVMLEKIPEAPAWPQLPKRSFMENMYIQYSKNMPGVVIDKEKQNIKIDPERIDDLEILYQKYMENDYEYFALGEEYCAGFYLYLDFISNLKNKPKVLKGQVTGPVSFGLTVKQPNGQSIIFADNYFDAILKTLVKKAVYQVEEFKKISPSSIPLIFFDEPYLVSFGSAFVSLNKDDVIAKLNECFDAVEGMSGIHVCGGTDWGMIMETRVDVIHFDAFDYFESITAYPEQLSAFIDRGGMIGWGITPHTPKVMNFSPEGLFDLLEIRFDRLEELGLNREKLYRSSWIAPSCGTAVMSAGQAETALGLSSALTNLIRRKLDGS